MLAVFAVALAGAALSGHQQAATAKPLEGVEPAVLPVGIAAPTFTDDRTAIVNHKRVLAAGAAREERPPVAAAASTTKVAAAPARARTTRGEHRAASRRPAGALPARRPADQLARRTLVPVSTPVAVAAAAGDRGAVIAFALAQVGKPYVWAAAGPRGFDCSGLVMAAYAQIGVRLPHQTGGIIRYGTPVSRGQLQPGDIVFPSSGHVAIYLGGGQIVHAPHPGDHIRVANLYAFWAARRV